MVYNNKYIVRTTGNFWTYSYAYENCLLTKLNFLELFENLGDVSKNMF